MDVSTFNSLIDRLRSAARTWGVRGEDLTDLPRDAAVIAYDTCDFGAPFDELLRVARRHLSANARRRWSAARFELGSDVEIKVDADWEAPFDRAAELIELRDQVEVSLRRLPQRIRLLLEWRSLGFSWRTIADHTGRSTESLRQEYSRDLRRARMEAQI